MNRPTQQRFLARRLLSYMYGQIRHMARNLARAPLRHPEPYTTHLPVLVGLARLITIRYVLELGCGMHSTLAFLDRDIFPDLVKIDSLETDRNWIDAVADVAGDDPRLGLTLVDGPMYRAVVGRSLLNYDLIFIDDSLTSEERAATIRVVSQMAPARCLIAIHDFEQEGYQRAAQGLPTRFIFTALNPYTGLVWRGDGPDMTRLRELNRFIAHNPQQLHPGDQAGWMRMFNTL